MLLVHQNNNFKQYGFICVNVQIQMFSKTQTKIYTIMTSTENNQLFITVVLQIKILVNI